MTLQQTIAEYLAGLLAGLETDAAKRRALALARRDVTHIVAHCVDAGLSVEGADVRPVLYATIDAALALMPEEEI